MTISRSSLLLLAGALLAGCGQTPAQKAETARDNEAAQREADLDQVRSDLRNMAEVQNRLSNIADEALADVEARRRADEAAAADAGAPAQ